MTCQPRRSPANPGTRLPALDIALQIIRNFSMVARILSDRQHGRQPFEIESEYDVQDVLFATLRASFVEARREDLTPQLAGSSKRIDIVLPEIRSLVEAKYVRNANHARRVIGELQEDFECYHTYPGCDHIFALVFDPETHIRDSYQFGEDLSGLRVKGDSAFEVHVEVSR